MFFEIVKESNSDYMQLLKIREEDDSRVFEWIKKITDKYTSDDIQNEMIKVMALQVLQEVNTFSIFCTLMVDETTDASNREQVVLCIHWVDVNFKVHEVFIG